MVAAVVTFLKDLLADLKSSRKFQAGTVIWIPLFVTICIMVVFFGRLHTISEEFPIWKTTFIPQNTIAYPNIRVYNANPNGWSAPPVCYQWSSPVPPTGAFSVTAGVPCPNPFLRANGANCYQLNLGVFSSSGEDVHKYSVECRFFYSGTGNPTQSAEMFVFLPGGFGSTVYDGYFQDGEPIRPNRAAAIHIEPHHVYPITGSASTFWHHRTHYFSTEFPDTVNAYNSTLFIRIPFTVVEVNWQSHGFNNWLLMAAWGGGIFFFYFLHMVVFGFAKLFLPQDSRLLRSGGDPSTEFTPIK